MILDISVHHQIKASYYNLTLIFIAIYLSICNIIILLYFLDSFCALCDAVQIFQQDHKPKEITRVRGMSVQNKNLNTEFTDEFFEEAKKNIGIFERHYAITCKKNLQVYFLFHIF